MKRSCLFLFLAMPLLAGKLVLKNGQSFLFPGRFEVKGSIILFRNPAGSLFSLPSSWANLDQSDPDAAFDEKMELLFAAEAQDEPIKRSQTPQHWPSAPDYEIEIRDLPVLSPRRGKRGSSGVATQENAHSSSHKSKMGPDLGAKDDALEKQSSEKKE